MHIAHIIVNARARLAYAEYLYSKNLKGDAARVLNELKTFLGAELPGMTTSAEAAEPEPVQQESIGPENRVN